MDIQIVKSIEFYKRRTSVEIGEDVKTKYAKLIEQYNCFSDKAVVVIQPNIVKTHIKKSIHHVSNRTKEPKTIKRYMLGILNIINDDNYRKLLLKIKMFVNIENIKEIFEEIFDKCAYQVFFLHIYIALIKDLMLSFNDKEQVIALSVINEFVMKFLNHEYILRAVKTDNSYNDFCAIQKNKMLIISKNVILIELLKNTDFVKISTYDAYSQLIFSEFMSHIHTNIEISDVLLQMMLELSKHGSRFNCELFRHINTNQKLKFMIDDLNKMQIHGCSQNPR